MSDLTANFWCSGQSNALLQLQTIEITCDANFYETDPGNESTIELEGVHMTLGRLSCLRELTLVPSRGFVFVYMMPPQNVIPERVTPAWVHTGSQRYHVNAIPPLDSVWNRPPVPVNVPVLSAGRLERVAHASGFVNSGWWSWDDEKTCKHVNAICVNVNITLSTPLRAF